MGTLEDHRQLPNTGGDDAREQPVIATPDHTQARHEAQPGGDRWIKVGCFVIILGALLLIAARSTDAAIDKDSKIQLNGNEKIFEQLEQRINGKEEILNEAVQKIDNMHAKIERLELNIDQLVRKLTEIMEDSVKGNANDFMKTAAQGRAASGNWGEWSSDYLSTTRKDDNEMLGGSLKLLSAGSDNLKVKWTRPAVIGEKIDSYQLFISVASQLDEHPNEHGTPGAQTDYHFGGLRPVTQYNVTVEGTSTSAKLWFISNVFSTTDHAEGLLDWLAAPTDLRLIEKSQTMLHVDWVPPEIFDEEKRELLTHYRVTIAPYNHATGKTGTTKNYTVTGNSIKFEGLTLATIYNITVQGGTSSGYGHVLWGVYSTVNHGERHILKLRYRTPTSLHVEWDPVWTSSRGYILEATLLHSVFKEHKSGVKKQFEVDLKATDFIINGLHPSTMYNVTLRPKDQQEGAWGAYATLPPGWFTVKNLKQCDKTNFAVSLSWEPVDQNQGTHYQVRYLKLKDRDAVWQEETAREVKHLLCPKDFCGRHCYLVFNLPSAPGEYVFQVRAQVGGDWNMWKSAGKQIVSEPHEVRRSCCIVPPPSFYVENIGMSGTSWEIDLQPAETTDNLQRYYVVVVERDPAGDSNWAELTDKVTATKLGLPYYVTASYNRETLGDNTKVKMGDGSVIGGYLNYPLTKGKKYNYEVYTLWNITSPVHAQGDEVVARYRGKGGSSGMLKSQRALNLNATGARRRNEQEEEGTPKGTSGTLETTRALKFLRKPPD